MHPLIRVLSHRETDLGLHCLPMIACANFRVTVVPREGRHHLGGIHMKGFKDNFVIITSLKVNYCDQYMSVAPPSVRPSTISTNEICSLTNGLISK